MRDRYGDDRRTEIIDESGELSIEDLIAEEDMAITVSNTGYIKRTAISTYRNQRRGGKGRIGMRTRDEDFVSHLFVASTHAYIMIFSDRGRAYWLKVHEIPDVGPGGKGKSIANLVSMEEGEKIAAMLAVKEFDDDKFIVMGTRRGVVKKTVLSAFSNPRAGGIIAMGVEEGDAVIAAQVTDGTGQVFIGTRNGMAIRFEETDVRPMGRTAYGVRGISLRDDDYVVAMEVVRPGGALLTVTEGGLASGRKSTNIACSPAAASVSSTSPRRERNGPVVGIAYVQEGDELLLITQQGMILRMQTNDVRAIGRATQGVKLIDIGADDNVVSIARLVEKEDEENPISEQLVIADCRVLIADSKSALNLASTISCAGGAECSARLSIKVRSPLHSPSRLSYSRGLLGVSRAAHPQPVLHRVATPRQHVAQQSDDGVVRAAHPGHRDLVRDRQRHARGTQAAGAQGAGRGAQFREGRRRGIHETQGAVPEREPRGDPARAEGRPRKGQAQRKDAEVQATWSKFVQDGAAVSRKVSEAKRKLASESGLVDLSINGGSNTPIDITKHEGELVSKDVTINAVVKLPSGETAPKTFVVTMQRAVLKADREITGRWIIAAIKDAAAPAGGKTSIAWNRTRSTLMRVQAAS